MGGLGGSAEVVSITARSGFRHRASLRVANARAQLGMTTAEYAAHLTSLLGWRVTTEAVEHWEGGAAPPGEVIETCVTGATADSLTLLDPIPASFPAAALAGYWLTVYQFSHAGQQMVHADVAAVTAESDRLVRVLNHPPEPRTQGRSKPFRNEIEAELIGRHLIGRWRNTSDARYFGQLQLAVLPGESAMDGYYTGLASDVEVSTGRWLWLRLSATPGELDGLALRTPEDLMTLATLRPPTHPPLTVDDIREDT